MTPLTSGCEISLLDFRIKLNTMKKLMLISLLALFYSCNNDDAILYDPVAQLQTDLNLIDAHLAANGQAVIIHSTGIRYSIDNLGNGDNPIAGDSVATLYEIYALDGRLIDTTDEALARENGIYSAGVRYEAFIFQIGSGIVIEGYEIGTSLLNVGAEGTFYVPSTLAYKNTIGPGLEPNLIFRIKIRLQEIL